jgi:hypothetical protein
LYEEEQAGISFAIADGVFASFAHTELSIGILYRVASDSNIAYNELVPHKPLCMGYRSRRFKILTLDEFHGVIFEFTTANANTRGAATHMDRAAIWVIEAVEAVLVEATQSSPAAAAAAVGITT